MLTFSERKIRKQVLVPLNVKGDTRTVSNFIVLIKVSKEILQIKFSEQSYSYVKY